MIPAASCVQVNIVHSCGHRRAEPHRGQTPEYVRQQAALPCYSCINEEALRQSIDAARNMGLPEFQHHTHVWDYTHHARIRVIHRIQDELAGNGPEFLYPPIEESADTSPDDIIQRLKSITDPTWWIHSNQRSSARIIHELTAAQ